MRHIVTLALALATGSSALAQTITSVDISPNNPTTCDLIELEFNGTMPNNANLQSFSSTIVDDTLLVTFVAAGNGGGNGGFSQTITLSPPGVGVFIVHVVFVLNGNEVDTDSQSITITAGATNDPGAPGLLAGACTGGPSVPLLSLLEGTPDAGGDWYDPFNQPVPNGMFVPGQSPAGYYLYYFDVNEPCHDTAQTVEISYVSPAANAGLNATVQVCNDFGAVVDLFASLGGTPDAGGTWTAPGGGAHSSIYDPVVDPCGAYTYSVPGISPCPPTTANIIIQCVNPPNAGTVSAVNDTINRCYNDSIEVLSALVSGEQNTGAWFSPNGFIVGYHNDSVNIALFGGGIYSLIVPGTICPSDTSRIFVVLWGDSIEGCTIGMEEAQAHLARFEVMPNPAQDLVTIEVERSRTDEPMLLELMDVNGRVIRSERLNFNGLLARRTLAVGDLAKGAYLLRVGSAEGRDVRRLMLR